MTHKELTEKAAKWLKKHTQNIRVANCPLVVTDFVAMNGTGETPDVLGWNYCYSVLIEVKMSRSDFHRDKRKRFKKEVDMGMGQFRYYCCPTGLLKPEEMPDGWGLLYAHQKPKTIRIEIVKVADKLPANLDAERSMLLSIIRRSTQ